jgi:tRNA-Thr(GGU) m(6)t(6)A37 methyltransferase TsaA
MRMTGPDLRLTPIGRVSSARKEPIDDDWDDVEAVIELDSGQLGADATAGLETFSHVEIVYHFHAADDAQTERGARHPRGRSDWPKVGILAQRGKDRPNHIGVTICRLRSVDALKVAVEGLDAIDGTPVLDIKPVMAEFLPRGALRQPEWAGELMRGYWRRPTA